MKKIFFLGTPQIAVASLESLAKNPAVEIVGVGVFPDKAVGRKRILTPCPVKVAAEVLDLPVYEIENKEKLVEIAQSLDFDLGIVIAFGMIFPPTILTTENIFVNVHFSRLPEWRGASPVQAAILNGQTHTGITWQVMVSELDAGDILMQKEYKITDMNTAQVWDYFAKKTADTFPQFIDNYFAEKLNKTAQNKEKATFCGKFKKTDGLIQLNKNSAQEIYQKFLAFTPWPGIYMETKYGNLKILDCHLQVSEDESISIACAEDTELFIKTAQIAGKKPMPIKDILNGYPDIFDTVT